MDWVPAHFPTDEFGLADLMELHYEHEDPRKGFHEDWTTISLIMVVMRSGNFLFQMHFIG